MNNLVKLLQTMNVDLFYNVSISKDKITLQGLISRDTLKYAKSLEIVDFENRSGFLYGENTRVQIVLTF